MQDLYWVSRGKKKVATNKTEDSRRGLKTSLTQRSDDSNQPSSVDLRSNIGSRDGRVDSKLHFQQYQRDDEQPPWGFASVDGLGSSTTLGASSDGSRITRPRRAYTADSHHSAHRNPQVNDLHPALVTNIRSREEARWLMQPPPTVDIMTGKERKPRSRSDSGGTSRLSVRSVVPLSKEVSQRIMERRIKSGELPLTPALSRESTFQTPIDLTGQRQGIDTVDEIDFALEDIPTNPAKVRSAPVQMQVSEYSIESSDTVVRKPELAPEPIRTRRVASKPQLSTIASDSMVPSSAEDERRKENRSSRQSGDSLPERDRTARRSALLVKDDSLKVLQELAPHSAIFKTKVVSSQDLTKDSARRSSLPRQDTNEERDLEEESDLFDSWHTPDFALPDWIHEHTKREVKHRWSMDI